jgi:hypothetical protein
MNVSKLLTAVKWVYSPFHISKYIPYEPQFKNLQWLRQIEVIDSREFDAKRQELEKMFTTDVEFQFWNN